LATIQEQQKAIVNRRRTCARNCRKNLLAALASKTGTPELTFAQRAQVEMAVSCHVEAVEITSLYLVGKASDTKMSRLHLVRAQLMRLLASLGLTDDAVPGDPEPVDAPTGAVADETMEDVVAHFGASPKRQEAANGTPQPR
jgi:hypothetical protein